MPEMTQEHVNMLVGQAREEGRKSATESLTAKHQGEIERVNRELADTKKANEELANKHKAVETEYTAMKAEYGKKAEEFGKLSAEHETLKRALADRDFEDVLTSKGVKAEHKRDMRILLQAQNALVDDKGNQKDIDAVLTEWKPRYSAFFSDGQGANQPNAPGSRNPGTNSKPGAKRDIFDR